MESPPPSAPALKRSALPTWLPSFLLAAVPALVVGLAVYLVNGGGGAGGGGGAAAIVDGFIRLGGDTARVESFKGSPPGFPAEFPVYPGSSLVASFVVHDKGDSFLVLYRTQDGPDKIIAHFQQKLDSDPWQVEAARSSNEFAGLHFSRPDDADVEGDVTVHKSALEGPTVIFVALQDLSPAARTIPDKRFTLSKSRELPPGFPSDIPIYKSDASTIIDTIFRRGPGARSFTVTFLTRDSEFDVIDFYKDEFQKRGWTVTDSQTPVRGFRVGIEFSDGPKQEVQGTVTADSFGEDNNYTQVDLILEVSTRRGRGN